MRRQMRNKPEAAAVLRGRGAAEKSAASEGYIRGETEEETERREEADADRNLTEEQADDTFESRESSSLNKINRWRNNYVERIENMFAPYGGVPGEWKNHR